MKPAAVVYCPKCKRTFAALVVFEKVEPAEPWKDSDQAEDPVDTLTTCPLCGHETQVLHLSDEMRDALKPGADE